MPTGARQIFQARLLPGYCSTLRSHISIACNDLHMLCTCGWSGSRHALRVVAVVVRIAIVKVRNPSDALGPLEIHETVASVEDRRCLAQWLKSRREGFHLVQRPKRRFIRHFGGGGDLPWMSLGVNLDRSGEVVDWRQRTRRAGIRCAERQLLGRARQQRGTTFLARLIRRRKGWGGVGCDRDGKDVSGAGWDGSMSGLGLESGLWWGRGVRSAPFLALVLRQL